MYVSDQSKLRAWEQQSIDHQRFAWAMLVMGILTGLAGMHFLVARPMMAEMARMKTDVQNVREDMKQLAGETVGAGETQNLLSYLRSQRQELEACRQSLIVMNDLRKQIAVAGSETVNAQATVKAMADLQQTAIALNGNAEQAEAAISRSRLMSDTLSNQHAQQVSAETALAGLVKLRDGVVAQTPSLEQASMALAGLVGHNQKLVEEAPHVATAQSGLNQLSTLRQQVETASAGVETAQATATALVAVQNTLTREGLDTELAQRHSESLMALGRDLQNVTTIEGARNNLQGLVALEQSLNGQTKSLADATETLDLLQTFQGEIARQVQVFQSLRRDLLDVALLEGTIEQAIRVIRPLSELSDLRRMNDHDVRLAAKAILHERAELARRQDQIHNIASAANPEPKPEGETLVPMPLD